MTATETDLKHTPLDALHRELGGKMVPFAGYDMPVQYPAGILKEHLHTRQAAGLFDVSHMGQIRITGDNIPAALETLVPGDIAGLNHNQQRYSLFTNEQGGIRDDLMVTNAGDHFFMVVNASMKHADLEHMRSRIGDRVKIEYLEDRGLLALQGPQAAAVMDRLAPHTRGMPFMSAMTIEIGGVPAFITRSGYTGEDGFEISIPGDEAEKVARLLLDQPEVMPIGLGARDSLRLEAGLCLHGHDIDETTTPIEASLTWVIGKSRREAGGFPGADVILDQIKNGAPRKRVGIRPDGRAPAREGTEIAAADGQVVGRVTSGGFGPTVNAPVAMGYVAAGQAKAGTELQLIVRGKPLSAKVAPMPFAPHRYYRG